MKLKKLFKTVSTFLAALFVGVVGFTSVKPTTYEAKADFTEEEISSFVQVMLDDLIDMPGNPICFIMESGIVEATITENSKLNDFYGSSEFVTDLVDGLRVYIGSGEQVEGSVSEVQTCADLENANDELSAIEVFEELGYKAIGHVSDYTYVDLLTGQKIPLDNGATAEDFCSAIGVDGGDYVLVGTIYWSPAQVLFSMLRKLQKSTYGAIVYTYYNDDSPSFSLTNTSTGVEMRVSYRGDSLATVVTKYVSNS